MSTEKTEKINLPINLRNVKVWLLVKMLTKKAVKSLLIHWVKTFMEEIKHKVITEIDKDIKNANGVQYEDFLKAFDIVEKRAIEDLNKKPAKVIVEDIKSYLQKGIK